MKVFKSRGFALAVLVLVVVAGSLYGLSRKPIAVQYQQWIADDAVMLTESTRESLESYNDQWDRRYSAVVAVATVGSTHGWSGERYAAMLGKEWGLGQNDMLLLLIEGKDYYVLYGDSVNGSITDTQETALRKALDSDYYKGDYDRAALKFFRAADVVYDQMSKG